MPVLFHSRQTFRTILLLVAISLATPLWAQKDAGAMVGLVRDGGGAVVQGAKVTVEDVDRGVQMILSTDAMANMSRVHCTSEAIRSQ